MKEMVDSLWLAFAMYSRIPMPRRSLAEGEGRYVFAAFPLVGIVIGAAEYVWFGLAMRQAQPFFGAAEGGMPPMPSTFLSVAGGVLSTLPQPAVIAGAAVIPLVLTGGFHVDGFLDTTDALRSYWERDEKRRILKDPHIGAFAVIGLATYGLCYLGLLACLRSSRQVLFFAASFVMARIASGLCAIGLPKMEADGSLARLAERSKSGARRLLCLEMVAVLLLLMHESVIGAAASGIVAMVVTGYYRWCMEKEFGGTSGDTAGWYLLLLELALLAVAVCVSGG